MIWAKWGLHLSLGYLWRRQGRPCGNLKLIYPNVCQYNLLFGVRSGQGRLCDTVPMRFNYLRMLKRFPSVKTKRGCPCGRIEFPKLRFIPAAAYYVCPHGIAQATLAVADGRPLPPATCHKPILVAVFISIMVLLFCLSMQKIINVFRLGKIILDFLDSIICEEVN